MKEGRDGRKEKEEMIGKRAGEWIKNRSLICGKFFGGVGIISASVGDWMQSECVCVYVADITLMCGWERVNESFSFCIVCCWCVRLENYQVS